MSGPHILCCFSLCVCLGLDFFFFFIKLLLGKQRHSLSLKEVELEFIEINHKKSTSYRASVFIEKLWSEMATWLKCLAEAPRMQ